MKKNKPDEYFNNGIYEMVRYGNTTITKNIMNGTDFEKYRNDLREAFPIIKQEIDNLIASIRKKVCECNPIQLLTFASDNFLLSMINVPSEIQYPIEAVFTSRMTEYIQSILVSSPNYFDFSKKNMEDTTGVFLAIQADIDKLYKLIMQFYMSWGLNLMECHPEWDRSTIDTALESQMLFLVRGTRYPIIEIEYFSHLLKPHNEEFIKIFGLGSDDIIEGIKKLRYALSEGKLDACKEFEKLFDEMEKTEDLDIDLFKKKHTEQIKEFIDKFCGIGLRDVIRVTGWTEQFVKSLSFELNDDTDFFLQSEYAGWPIIDLPTQKRPFIKIEEQYLCFDYYTFVDNIYRAIQKAVSRKDPDYSWNDKQNEASEKMVEAVFRQLLPGCTSYRNNYYKVDESKNNYAENDLLVIFSGVIFIVEIKAGSFIYTAPITDFENHIKSYKSLVEAPDKQCKRTYDYLLSKDEVDIYDNEHNFKTTIDMSEISDVFMMSVTIDNINSFAAHAEKLSFLNLKCDAISIAIDDLMIYREYFSSPLEFLHFLKQRRNAIHEPKLVLNDELDHLGMYIEHNCYSMLLKHSDDKMRNVFYGYREKLDEYFSRLMHTELNPQKPIQNRSELFQKILEYLDNSQIKNKVQIADYILSFNSKAEEKFNANIDYVLKRQCQIGQMIGSRSGGTEDDLKYTCFIYQPNIQWLSENEKREYLLSTLLWNNEEERVMLELYFDEKGCFGGISMRVFTQKDISDNERKYLHKLGKQRADSLVAQYKEQHKGIIKPNSLCPCCSGRKYKNCCGK